MPSSVATFTLGLSRIPDLARFVDAERVVLWPPFPSRDLRAVVGWGRKKNTRLAAAFAAHHRLPMLRLEDGFLRSVGLGVDGAAPLSLVVDDVGMYYDATRPSRLERLLEAADPSDPLPGLVDRARAAIDAIVAAGLSKYNHAPDRPLPPLPTGRRNRVLVVDQTAGDLSIALGRPVPGGFAQMLKAALDENPDAEICIKTHPDVLRGRRRGALGAQIEGGRVRLLTEPMAPHALLREVDRVYAMTSLLGFEALLAGKPVSVFGAPFYAGWGLTDDRVPTPRRTRTRSLEELFAAAYFLYARYVDPETGERCEAERIIEHLTLQRRVASPDGRPIVCAGFSPWKRGFVAPFVGAPANRVAFRPALAVPRRSLESARALVVWGASERPSLRARADAAGVPLWRMEDGFLRSVGLGADFVAPASLVVDTRGIYFDPTQPSDLEHILEHEALCEDELRRARALREAMLAHGLSKYNVGRAAPIGLRADAKGRPVVLVVGQVEDDASIRLGCDGVRTNLGLLEAARHTCPDAFVVYKPHPDVLAGHRRGAIIADTVQRLADRVVLGAPISACLDETDALHTLTSLAGFEALLRERQVVCYGRPFYAGWGLTEDRAPMPRRTRRRSLDELVAATLIRYPRYVHPRSRAFTSPEAIVEQLRRELERPPSGLGRHRLGRKLNRWKNLFEGIRRAR